MKMTPEEQDRWDEEEEARVRHLEYVADAEARIMEDDWREMHKVWED